MTQLVVRGRYQIIPKGGKKPVAHTRVTNFAKKLEDGYTLTAWGKRMVLAGAAQRSDIIVAALAAGDDKGELDRLAESAMDAAKANVRRETGTALHLLCETVDQGGKVDMPSPWREDLEAYAACLRDLGATVERTEQVVVIPKLKLAGRFDRLVNIDGTTYVMDLKTGADLKYSWNSIAIQLALYASAETIYDGDNGMHEPMPAVDQARGLVIHLQAGEATATPYWVNLEAGRAGIALTAKVMEWRKQNAVSTQVGSGDKPAFTAAGALRAHVVERIEAIIAGGHGKDLAGRWPLDVPTLKASADHSEAQLDQILAACVAIEAAQQMAFPVDSDPRKQGVSKASKQKRSK